MKIHHPEQQIECIQIVANIISPSNIPRNNLAIQVTPRAIVVAGIGLLRSDGRNKAECRNCYELRASATLYMVRSMSVGVFHPLP